MCAPCSPTPTASGATATPSSPTTPGRSSCASRRAARAASPGLGPSDHGLGPAVLLGNGRRLGAAVLVNYRREDQQEGQQPQAVDEDPALVVLVEERQDEAAHSEDSEPEREPVAGLAPVPEEDDRDHERRRHRGPADEVGAHVRLSSHSSPNTSASIPASAGMARQSDRSTSVATTLSTNSTVLLIVSPRKQIAAQRSNPVRICRYDRSRSTAQARLIRAERM